LEPISQLCNNSTVDAIGCQHEIAEKIVDRKADYELALKANQGDLHREVGDPFA